MKILFTEEQERVLAALAEYVTSGEEFDDEMLAGFLAQRAGVSMDVVMSMKDVW